MARHNYRQVAKALALRQPFNGLSMRGEAFPRGCGQLSRGQGDEAPPPDAVYVVWSYTTPIAWVLPDGSAYRVERKFSVTTSRHQSMTRVLLSAAQQRALERERAKLLAMKQARREEMLRRREERVATEGERLKRFVERHEPAVLSSIQRSYDKMAGA